MGILANLDEVLNEGFVDSSCQNNFFGKFPAKARKLFSCGPLALQKNVGHDLGKAHYKKGNKNKFINVR